MPNPATSTADDDSLERVLVGAALQIDAVPHVLRAAPAVMAAWAQADAIPGPRGGAGTTREATSRGLKRWLHVRRDRRVPAVIRPLLAGGLAILLTTGTAAASTTPGAPLYATRLGIERAFLPTPGSAERSTAEVAYADRRLAEAREAAERGDQPAVVAALDAFTDGLRELERDAADRAPEVRQHIASDAVALADLRSRSSGAATLVAIATAEREAQLLAGHLPNRRGQGEPIGPDSSRRP